jgi:KUP system potassium uptake protein
MSQSDAAAGHAPQPIAQVPGETAVDNPFYRLYLTWSLAPMVILASLATIIASQAVISGAFSMTSQAVQLGYLPRMEIRHTSARERGQIYVPKINLMLLVAVVALVLGFKSSSNLGAAYGIAVTGTMSLTTMLAFLYMLRVRCWSPVLAYILFGVFLVVDLAFFGANMLKVTKGGWAPLLIGIVTFTVMSTWTTGRAAIMARRREENMPLEMFLGGLRPDRPLRVEGTAPFLTADVDKVPASLLHNLKHNKVLHERVVLLSIKTLDIPVYRTISDWRSASISITSTRSSRAMASSRSLTFGASLPNVGLRTCVSICWIPRFSLAERSLSSPTRPHSQNGARSYSSCCSACR